MASSHAKAPAFSFYPGDWRRDVALQSCSLEARGLWAELLWLMHDGVPYGHLATLAGAIADDRVAAMIGVPPAQYRRLLAELEAAGVPSRTESGVLFSRRMVRDAHLRAVRASAGSKGGSTRVHNERSKSLSKNPSSDPDSAPIIRSSSDAPDAAEVASIATATATADANATASEPLVETVLQRLRDLIPPEHHGALEGYRRTARFQASFLAEILRLHEPITGGQAFDGATIGQALSKLAANGEAFNVSRLAGYCRRLVDGPPPSRRPLADDEEDDYTRAAREVREERLAREAREGAARATR